jgi:hypothetical protein
MANLFNSESQASTKSVLLPYGVAVQSLSFGWIILQVLGMYLHAKVYQGIKDNR